MGSKSKSNINTKITIYFLLLPSTNLSIVTDFQHPTATRSPPPYRSPATWLKFDETLKKIMSLRKDKHPHARARDYLYTRERRKRTSSLLSVCLSLASRRTQERNEPLGGFNPNCCRRKGRDVYTRGGGGKR